MTYPQQPPPAPKPVSPRLAFWTSGAGIVCMFAILAALLVGGALALPLFQGSKSDDLDVAVTGCERRTGSSIATVGFTVRNLGDKVRTVRLSIEFRDSSGARLDTDTAYVRNIAPGDTVRGQESTSIGAGGSGIECSITGAN